VGVPGNLRTAATLAPAKVNLYLDVLGRRADGYHELETLFLALPWGDDVEVLPGEAGRVDLEVQGDVDVPAGEENLAARAARAFAAETGSSAGVRLRLRKRIPVGGGLGGGSSDAGAVLRLLDGLHGPLPRARLAAIARTLGADVPFFLEGGAAIGRGRGDDLAPLPSPPAFDVVLVLPPQGHATSLVFAHADRRLRAAPRDGLAAAVSALRSGVPERIRDAHHNALAGAAMAAYPPFTRFVSDVERRLGRPPMMSGSGSTLFDVPDLGETDDVLRRLSGLPARTLAVRHAP
jgi:4-diphosphocytidyl-2-C-methyl-D-erythritol kinase